MKVGKSIDWLTATRTKTLLREMPNYLPDGLEMDKELEGIPRFENVFSLLPAGIVAHSADNAMCMMIVLTGDDLQTVRDYGMSTDDILADVTKKMNSVTRLDYAVDVMDGKALPNDVLKLWQRGLIKTHYRTVESYRTLTGYEGETVYFGSKRSDQRIRIYNKAAEQEMIDMDWLRVELQLRKKRATNLAGDMVAYGMARVGDTRIRELLKIDDLQWWKSAIDGKTVPLTEVPREISRWQKWMGTQVLPSIQSRITESKENAEFVREWLFRVELMLLGGEEIEQ